MVKENSNQISKGTKNNNTVPVANNVNANVENKNKAIKNNSNNVNTNINVQHVNKQSVNNNTNSKNNSNKNSNNANTNKKNTNSNNGTKKNNVNNKSNNKKNSNINTTSNNSTKIKNSILADSISSTTNNDVNVQNITIDTAKNNNEKTQNNGIKNTNNGETNKKSKSTDNNTIKEGTDKAQTTTPDNNDRLEKTVETSIAVIDENISKKEKKKKLKEEKKNEKISLGTEKTAKTLNLLAIFGILFACLVIILLIVFFVFAFMMNNNNNIFSGIYVKDIDVSDLSKEEATNKINECIKSKLPEEIVLIHDDYETALPTEELEIKFSVSSSIDTAYNLGRGGNLVSNGFDILSIMFNNKNVDLSYELNDETLDQMLNDISGKLPDKVIESGYYIDGSNLILNKGSKGYVVDVKKTKKKIKEAINNLNLIDNKLEIATKSASPDELNLDAIYEEVHKDAVDASFTKEPLSVTPSKNGVDFSISLDEAKEKLKEDEQECVIPLKVVYPNVTTNMIGTEAFPDKLSEFSTNYAASNVNRTTNLRLAASKINGTVLMPGETFSYNQVVGERTIAAGYKEAPIYVSGRVEDGLGGGICQITTTLYNAVVYANLEVVERTNHQFVPSYVGAGRDATVVYGALDFKFKNNRNYPIKIICSVSGGVANFKILGLKTDEDYDVEISSTITSQTANATNSATYKILKKNGNVVDRILLSRDTYKRH